MTSLSNLTVSRAAAHIATFLFAVMIVVQLLLAAGILPISIAWGGRQTELTPALRVASVIAAVLLGAFLYVIRYRAGLWGRMPIPRAIRVLSWIITAFMAFNTLGNFASLSNTERFFFGPIAFALTIACFIVSVSSPEV
ncbi:MAG: hypothetical protein KBE23_05320 [Chloroflexi bacterium]|nr:hypothetical protein [Chloroflexota bacterium]MBP7042140.1 hypothetical protein [Chloroflexota bacterium]